MNLRTMRLLTRLAELRVDEERRALAEKQKDEQRRKSAVEQTRLRMREGVRMQWPGAQGQALVQRGDFVRATAAELQQRIRQHALSQQATLEQTDRTLQAKRRFDMFERLTRAELEAIEQVRLKAERREHDEISQNRFAQPVPGGA